MLELPARQFQPAELALEVSEWRTPARLSALDLGEEHVVRAAGRLLGDPALQGRQGLLEERLPPPPPGHRTPGELVAALLRETLSQVHLICAEDVDAETL